MMCVCYRALREPEEEEEEEEPDPSLSSSSSLVEGHGRAAMRGRECSGASSGCDSFALCTAIAHTAAQSRRRMDDK